MKRIIKRNQAVITALAVMLAVAGYLTYAGSVDETKKKQEQMVLGSASYDLNQEKIPLEEMEAETKKQAENSAADELNEMDVLSLDYDIEDPKKAVLANGTFVTDYLASAKLMREQVRGKNKEELLKIIDNEEEDGLNRQAAVDKMLEIADNSDKECAVETLLSAKGFEHAMVNISDGKADVVICQSAINDAQLAQIEDIVKRKAQVSAADIVISLMEVTP